MHVENGFNSASEKLVFIHKSIVTLLDGCQHSPRVHIFDHTVVQQGNAAVVLLNLEEAFKPCNFFWKHFAVFNVLFILVFLHTGVNTVTSLVESKKAQLVVIAHDVDPIEVSALFA